MWRWLLAGAVFGLIVAGCSTAEPESQSKEPPTPLRTPVATDTSRPEATPTPTPEPDCEEKCQTVRAYTPVPTTTPAPPAAAYPQGTRTGVAEVDAIVA